jgi:hypothetical protein
MQDLEKRELELSEKTRLLYNHLKTINNDLTIHDTSLNDTILSRSFIEQYELIYFRENKENISFNNSDFLNSAYKISGGNKMISAKKIN